MALTTALNANPILTTADSDTSSGWRAAQTLNTGTIPGYTSKRQWGIQVYQIALMANSATPAAGQIVISDPLDGTILWSFANTATSATIGQMLAFEDLQHRRQRPRLRCFSTEGLCRESLITG
jgi:hypothetical protein